MAEVPAPDLQSAQVSSLLSLWVPTFWGHGGREQGGEGEDDSSHKWSLKMHSQVASKGQRQNNGGIEPHS